jgi:hypothetical protein
MTRRAPSDHRADGSGGPCRGPASPAATAALRPVGIGRPAPALRMGRHRSARLATTIETAAVAPRAPRDAAAVSGAPTRRDPPRGLAGPAADGSRRPAGRARCRSAGPALAATTRPPRARPTTVLAACRTDPHRGVTGPARQEWRTGTEARAARTGRTPEDGAAPGGDGRAGTAQRRAVLPIRGRGKGALAGSVRHRSTRELERPPHSAGRRRRSWAATTLPTSRGTTHRGGGLDRVAAAAPCVPAFELAAAGAASLRRGLRRRPVLAASAPATAVEAWRCSRSEPVALDRGRRFLAAGAKAGARPPVAGGGFGGPSMSAAGARVGAARGRAVERDRTRLAAAPGRGR